MLEATESAHKVNVIGLLDAGLCARDSVSNLGFAPYVSSFTTDNSPHRGSELFEAMWDGTNEEELLGGIRPK